MVCSSMGGGVHVLLCGSGWAVAVGCVSVFLNGLSLSKVLTYQPQLTWGWAGTVACPLLLPYSDRGGMPSHYSQAWEKGRKTNHGLLVTWLVMGSDRLIVVALCLVFTCDICSMPEQLPATTTLCFIALLWWRKPHQPEWDSQTDGGTDLCLFAVGTFCSWKQLLYSSQ